MVMPPAYIARMVHSMKIVSWNVNSVRARLPHVTALLSRQQPDVVCIQEVKSAEQTFPFDQIRELDYQVALHGERTYNGVAILSRSPLKDVVRGLDDQDQARVIAATCHDTRIVNVYVPNGARIGSDKHAYKLRWLDALVECLDRERADYGEFVLVGDFNVVPGPIDAAHPDQWEGHILFDPKARDKLEAIVRRYSLEDLHRKHAPGPGEYTWWDYRNDGYARNDGLRIDFTFATPTLAAACTNAWVDLEERARERPSDHAPVLFRLLRQFDGHPAV